MSCKNTQEFLAQNEILDGTVQSAGKEPVEGEDALQLLEGISDLYIAKGKQILHFDIEAERPSDSELLALLLGRSGKLRAPAIRQGSRFVVGCNQEILPATLE